MIKVPALGLSMAVQRLLNAERTAAQAAVALADQRGRELEELRAQLPAAEADE